MTDKSEGQLDNVLSSLDMAIGGLDFAKDAAMIAPAKAVFCIVSALLTTIRVRSLPFCDEMRRVHTKPGHKGQ